MLHEKHISNNNTYFLHLPLELDIFQKRFFLFAASSNLYYSNTIGKLIYKQAVIINSF